MNKAGCVHEPQVELDSLDDLRTCATSRSKQSREKMLKAKMTWVVITDDVPLRVVCQWSWSAQECVSEEHLITHIHTY